MVLALLAQHLPAKFLLFQNRPVLLVDPILTSS
jgi:hypothetical protein